MAKPNYAFEKRQRELAKKRKKEEKAEEKAARKTHPGSPDGQPAEDDDPAVPPPAVSGQP